MDGMGDDDRLGDDTPADPRHDSTHDDAVARDPQSPSSGSEQVPHDMGLGDTDAPHSFAAKPHGPDETWDDDDDDDDDDEPFDAELLLLLERIDWSACDLDPDGEADQRTGELGAIVDDPFETRAGVPRAGGYDHETSACSAAMAEILHPSASLGSAPPAGGGQPIRPTSGGSGQPRRQSVETSGAIVPILFAVAGVFAMVAIVQLIPGEWPFWSGRSSGVAAQSTTSTTEPHPATFALLTEDESKTAVVASSTGLLATISRQQPARSVTVAHQLWVDTAKLLAWDETSGVAVYEISSTHPMPTVPQGRSAGSNGASFRSSGDPSANEIQVDCDGTCPALPGAPVQHNGMLVGLVALDEYESSTRRTQEDDRVITIPLERLQEIVDGLVKAGG